MITSSNSLFRERDAQSSGRCPTSHHVRFRAVPRTNRTLTTVNTHSHSATSNTTGSPACAPSLPWQCSCVDASSGEYTDVASQDGYALLLGPPPPARSATRNCPVCRCAPAVACQHWTPHSDRVECVELYFWEIDDMAKQAGKRKNGAKADATVGLPPLNLHAAGIDVGSAEHYVAGTAGPRCRTGAKIHGEIAYADSALGHFIDFHIYTTIL